MEQIELMLGDKTVLADESIDVVNPFNGTTIALVPSCAASHIDVACEVASGALERGLPQSERIEILERVTILLRERAGEFASTIALESGKPIQTALIEANRCAETFAFASANCRLLSGEMVALDASRHGQGRVGFTIVEPIGVVGAITPFNFPLNLVAHKIAPAIAAGCPVVLKPAELTPLSAIRLVALLVEAGMPRDWISVVTGLGHSVGQALVSHDTPQMLTFTGSTTVGWQIAAAAPRKKVALELGSTAPLILEPNCDVETVAAKVRSAGFAHAGQSCISTQRILVQNSIKDSFVEALVKQVESLKVGDPLIPETEVGPLITEQEAIRVESWIAEAVKDGAKVAVGGNRSGAIVEPTVLLEPTTESKVWEKELFGPAVSVIGYENFDQALEMANDTELALQAGIWTSEVSVALQAMRKLDYGGVLINEVPTYRADQQPYGGRKQAGNTNEGPAYVIREMTREKFVMFAA